MFSVYMDSILWTSNAFFSLRFTVGPYLTVTTLRETEHRQYGIHNCCYFPQDLESHIWNHPQGAHLDNRPIQTAGNSRLIVTMLFLTDFKKEKDREKYVDRCMNPISSPNLLFIYLLHKKYVGNMCKNNKL